MLQDELAFKTFSRTFFHDSPDREKIRRPMRLTVAFSKRVSLSLPVSTELRGNSLNSELQAAWSPLAPPRQRLCNCRLRVGGKALFVRHWRVRSPKSYLALPRQRTRGALACSLADAAGVV